MAGGTSAHVAAGLTLLATACFALGQELGQPAVPPAQLATEVERVLVEHDLRPWFPRCVDKERGGFHEVFDEKWNRVATDARSLIFQSRMVWTCATAARFKPDLAEEYGQYARHGLRFIQSTLRDAEHGGLYFQRLSDGRPTPEFGDEKHAYALSFAIYAAAAAHRVAPDAGALDLAIQTFRWLDQHGYDHQHGGYLEAFRRDGTPILDPADSPRGKPLDCIGTLYGYKDQNTHLHLLEAFTELYRVWPDPLLRSRLEELLALLRDRIQVPPGCLNLYFTRDWRAVPDHDSFGHDVEAAYLMLEAADALGHPDDPRTGAIARQLVDHALAYGWDETHGGFFDKGAAFKKAHDRNKIWWVQVEGLNTLLLMHERHGGETPVYGQRFLQQWQFITRHSLDGEHRGWYVVTAENGQAAPGQNKGGHWKAAYHSGRALMNVAERLRRLGPDRPLRAPAPATSPTTQR